MVVRPSANGDHVVCIGGGVAKHLDVLPESIGIVLLSSGHGDPLTFYKRGIDGAVYSYFNALSELPLVARLVLIGYSYSGLVAYALTAHLRITTSWDVKAILLEPSADMNLRARVRHIWVDRVLGLRGRMTGARAWLQIGPQLRINVIRYRARKTSAEGIHLVSGNEWIHSAANHFEAKILRGCQIHRAGDVSHFELIEHPDCIALWRSLVSEAFAAPQSGDLR